ncbi:hypothetical protein NKR19_g6551 [Coniochaeta hoffmannii]|uniref:Uncharacterized protein n=1 Tax=Coniochaeta hoffmannii TaxID=91930 RepID=A0AA38RQQ7_9PEZI|nr:hypothetical protein NKR19_g6551 [Coniochaeta hoffmannii]
MNEFGNLNLHTVVRATLPCGLQFPLDLTCLQLGCKHSVVSRSSFSHRHIHQLRGEGFVLDPVPIGRRTIMYGLQRGPAQMLIRECMVEHVVYALARQLELATVHVQVRRLLQLNETDFSQASTATVDVAKRGLSFVADQIRDGAGPHCHCPADWPMGAVSPDNDQHVRLAYAVVLLYFCTKKDCANHQRAWDRWIEVMDLGPLPGLDFKRR